MESLEDGSKEAATSHALDYTNAFKNYDPILSGAFPAVQDTRNKIIVSLEGEV